MKSTERFSDRVADYVRYRPRYPRAVLGVLRAQAGLTADWTIADVGSGTGLSAELFVDNGNTVWGVEPNPDMREAAETLLSERPAFRSVDGRAEATGLEVASVDLVVIAQAFHWLDPVATRRELVRILRPPRWVALLWNTRRTTASPFLRDYETMLLRHGTDYREVRHDRIDRAVLDPFFGGPWRRTILDNEQALDLDGLKGRVLSSSYTPAGNDPRRVPLLREIERLFQSHSRDQRVVIEYDTEICLGTLT